MSANETIAALQRWLAAQTPPLNATSFRYAPPWPYSGSYPYVFLLPRTQELVPVGGPAEAWQGWWRLVWVNTIDQENDNTDQLMERCAAFGEALRAALASSALDRQLRSPALIASAGWGPEGGGPGVRVDWDGRFKGLNEDSVPFWAIPIDLFIAEQPSATE